MNHDVGQINHSTWFKVPIKNMKSESGADRLRLVSMHAGEVSGVSSLTTIPARGCNSS